MNSLKLRSDLSLRRPPPLGMQDLVISVGQRRRRQRRNTVLGGVATVAALSLVTTVTMGLTGGTKAVLSTDTPGAGTNSDGAGVVAPFDHVRIEGGVQTSLRKGGAYSVRVQASDRARPEISVRVSQRVLYVVRRYQPGPQDVVRVDITTPTLAQLELAGGPHAQLTGFVDQVARQVTMSGGAALSGQLSASTLTLTASGGVATTLQGTVRHLTASGSGGSSVRFERLVCEDAAVTLTGASSLDLGPAGRVTSASVNGASSLSLAPGTRVDVRNVDASSSIRVRG